jgi:hypothetical protein
MLNFKCLCGNTLYFENTWCVRCERELGFSPAHLALTAIEPRENDAWEALQLPDKPRLRKCANYTTHHICNWLIPAGDSRDYCLSCRFTSVIPNLDVPGNIAKWAVIATAKRRLFFTLLSLKLPLRAKAEDPETGLEFQFLADNPGGGAPASHVFTGHSDGVITLNILEADDAEREKVRVTMHEPYRTVLGHLRHEIGHYFWTLLVDKTGWAPRFASVFGDPSLDYGVALNNYHAAGPPSNWPERFVSAYASSHPWEDWAESWAHYLHIYDTLETARDLELSGKTLSILASADRNAPFEQTISAWESLSVILNCLNRSLGLRDAYPFVLAKPVAEKLRFIHELIAATGERNKAQKP